MALAEVRAAWQRTANRCLVQEDAKRAPKLACCSSVPPSIKQTDTEPAGAPGGQDIPATGPLPFNGNPSYSNLSPNSRWWLQLQPNYCFHKVLMDEQLNSREGNMETHRNHDGSGLAAGNTEACGLSGQSTYNESSSDDYCMNFVSLDRKDFGNKEEKFRTFCTQNHVDKPDCKESVGELKAESCFGSDASKKLDEHYLDSESSWVMSEKNTPWWRTADTEELALLVAQRSLDLIENCDLPNPQNSHLKKSRDGEHEIYSLSLERKPSAAIHGPFIAQAYKSCSRTGSAGPNLRLAVETQPVSPADRLRSPRQESVGEMHPFENDASKAQLLEALRHSQTRAREAEKAAKQAFEEKEHVLKLVLRQASQLFAYKQWLQLLQLENMCFQFKTNKNQSTVPLLLNWAPQRNRKIRKNGPGHHRKKRARRSRPQHDVGKFAVAFALGLGLVGAGLFLGWTVGWMLPTW